MSLRFTTLALALLSASQLFGQALSPKEILARCDAARGNLEGIQWTVHVEENTGSAKAIRSIHVKARGFDMVAETLKPARQKNHKLLLVQNNMWFYKPGLSKPVPVSLRQKLTGQAANGDIASTNYAEDYEIISQEDDTLNGEACYRFQLKASKRSVTYENVEYWVSKERLLGLRADYYTASGKKRLKTALMEYDNQIEMDGETRPFISAMTITDALHADRETRLEFTEPKVGAIPDRSFSVQRLSR